MFDISLPKLLVLAVIALVVFGPKNLPKIAARAGSALRELRRIADAAKPDLRKGLGPEFSNFDIDDLNPRRSYVTPAARQWSGSRIRTGGMRYKPRWAAAQQAAPLWQFSRAASAFGSAAGIPFAARLSSSSGSVAVS
jgi:TatA/E family protein of Tat protein translocase